MREARVRTSTRSKRRPKPAREAAASAREVGVAVGNRHPHPVVAETRPRNPAIDHEVTSVAGQVVVMLTGPLRGRRMVNEVAAGARVVAAQLDAEKRPLPIAVAGGEGERAVGAVVICIDVGDRPVATNAPGRGLATEVGAGAAGDLGVVIAAVPVAAAAIVGPDGAP